MALTDDQINQSGAAGRNHSIEFTDLDSFYNYQTVGNRFNMGTSILSNRDDLIWPRMEVDPVKRVILVCFGVNGKTPPVSTMDKYEYLMKKRDAIMAGLESPPSVAILPSFEILEMERRLLTIPKYGRTNTSVDRNHRGKGRKNSIRGMIASSPSFIDAPIPAYNSDTSFECLPFCRFTECPGCRRKCNYELKK